ncbi:MAG: SirB2 family protein [Mariprofundaceae bacterium]|nr:SirB2 family protein [Mariprofundaceae bacterium]
MLHWLLPLHLTLVGMLMCIFIWRVSYIWQGKVIPYRWLKRGLPDVVDTSVLVSGLILAIRFELTPWEDDWFAVKLLAIVIYIGAGFFCFSSKRVRTSQRWAAALSLCMLFYIVALVATKQIFLGLV